MLTIGNQKFNSRLLLGTVQYPSIEILMNAITQSKTEIITVSLRRHLGTEKENYFWQEIKNSSCQVLPNTAGCYSAKEAITTAEMARELFETNWIKLEVIGDDYTLQPNVFELVKAASELVRQGFEVLPYCTEDLVVCEELIRGGCKVLMPWGSPIGTGRGLQNVYALQLLRQRFPEMTLIIDAGIGKPSEAAQVMELGFDAVLLNTAVARAADPMKMANAFARAIESGRMGFEAGLITPSDSARASTPLIDRPFWFYAELVEEEREGRKGVINGVETKSSNVEGSVL